jgi:hypothetical protein
MKRLISLLLILSFTGKVSSQDLKSFFNSNSKVTYLGIDFSNVKLIGDFSEIFGIGDKSMGQIRNTYFPAWNRIILDEREKYNLNEMLRRDNIYYDIDDIMNINSQAPLDSLESYNTIFYSQSEINQFVSKYKIQNKNGYAILFLAEYLNKAQEEASLFFIVLSASTGDILLCERIMGEPSGFGIRNYWAGAIYDIIKQIKKSYYFKWNSQ